MAKQPAGSPFERYVREARSPEMREVARIALARGLSQEQLAALYGASGANVMRHFTAQRSSAETISAYARALGVHREHLDLAAGKALAPARAAATLSRLRDDLRAMVHPTAAKEASQKLAAASKEAREQILATYALENHRLAHTRGKNDASPLAPLEKALPGIDFQAARLVSDPNDSFLVTVFVAARGVLDEERQQSLLLTARALAKDQGLDTSQMETRLKKAMGTQGGRFYKSTRTRP